MVIRIDILTDFDKLLAIQFETSQELIIQGFAGAMCPLKEPRRPEGSLQQRDKAYIRRKKRLVTVIKFV